jgi:PAS domain S-box-containing protein
VDDIRLPDRSSADAGLTALAEALGEAAGAERTLLAVLDGARLRFVACSPSSALPEPLVTGAHPALQRAMRSASPVAVDGALAAALGGPAQLLALSVDGETLGAIVCVHREGAAERVAATLVAAAPLAAAHVLTWVRAERANVNDRDIRLRVATISGLADGVTDAMRVIDLDGRILRWNRAAERMFGWTEAEVLGKVLPAIPAEARVGVLADLRRIAESMQPVMRQSHNVRKDGSRLSLTLQIYPLLGDDGQLVFATFAHEVGADSRVDRLQEEFCSLVSTSLKAPLTGILGYTQLLRRADLLADPRRRTRVLEALDAQAWQLHTLVDDLLLLSSVQEGALRLDVAQVDLAAIVGAIVGEFQERHCLTVKLEVEPRLPDVLADEARVRQALGHVLSNAATYSVPNGEIRVAVAREGRDGIVTVTDPGEGIPAEDMPRVWDRFARGSCARGQGAGIGLYLVRMIAEAHGGSARIASIPGEGCTVTLRLPLRLAF